MAPKRKCPTLTSSGEETSTGSEYEPAKPLQRKKSSSDSDSDSGYESNPEDGIRTVKSLAATKEGTRLKKKPGFERLWSDKDEIKLLRAMIKFRNNMKLNPSTHFRAFTDFLNKKSVKFDFPADKSQIGSKIRRMKAKFTKGYKTGRVWKESHDQKVAELSHVFWVGGGKKSKVPDSASKNVVDRLESPVKFEDDEWSRISSQLQLTSTGLEQRVLRIGMGMIGSFKMGELKEKWQQLRLSQLRIANERAMLVNDLVKLIMDAMDRCTK